MSQDPSFLHKIVTHVDSVVSELLRLGDAARPESCRLPEALPLLGRGSNGDSGAEIEVAIVKFERYGRGRARRTSRPHNFKKYSGVEQKKVDMRHGRQVLDPYHKTQQKRFMRIVKIFQEFVTG